ncbi:lycopene beta-cyclase CrtY [Parasphingorhabdus flavimaris]|uniref:Lycopene beta-cyclase CrtY n=1 Tax=Parasphingorhabdus flavimaris TaxID=266812 RepID=A0ABX2MZT7_9SPHN|nr:lycopene beta-cyclase CrtY [Parasphingorhabdus flavimaris]NVD26978.1 lycopene beta-cyclase CrtY [Parasphingorhabdus flavimaris]|tara:strand:- start:6883 stop:8052 length:1170 start_codon:yes stop_codon:yes gene_type:complete
MPSKTPPSPPYDLAIAGGGLAGGLVALALARLRPELTIALIEAETHFGGNHIWSFFDSDVAAGHRWLVDPLISRHWDSYDVHFPKYSRKLNNGYNSIESKNLDRELRKRFPADALKTGQKVTRTEPGRVHLADGTEIVARAVLDVRGGGDISALETGWQKFCGQMLRLKTPHGLERPIIMDATVDQIDGYRFVYCLPFSDTDIFVEDTYYADTAALDSAASHSRIAEYISSRGWTIESIMSEEKGQLPVIYGGDFEAFWKDNQGVEARAGARAALIQPITSYSLPMAVRTAFLIAEMPEITQNTLDTMLRDLAKDHWRKGKFYRLLCAFLFLGAEPEKRYKTLEHSYGKSEPLLARFYAGNSTLMDKIRLLSGKPPISVSRAIWLLLKF